MKIKYLLLFACSLTTILNAQEVRRAEVVNPAKTPAQTSSQTPTTQPLTTNVFAPDAQTTPSAPQPSLTPFVSPSPVVAPANASASPDDVARFLAGLPPINSGYLSTLCSTSTWINYSSDMSNGFARFDEHALSRVRQFSASQLEGIGTNGIFYPFSGPDFVYVVSMFPNASSYVLCGLEPVGALPEAAKIAPQNLSVALGGLHRSFHTLFTAGYFVTKDMRVDLKTNPIGGVLPILYIMIERTGNHIHSVKLLGNGVQITFGTDGRSGTRSLYYFSSDLSNDGFRHGSNSVVDFARQLHADTVYIKSASYLMHNDSFSRIRAALLSQSHAILQDDSGIPLNAFDPHQWSLRFYGDYSAPLNIFKQYYQPDLAAVYARGGSIAALNFGVGYAWNPKSANLMLATKK